MRKKLEGKAIIRLRIVVRHCALLKLYASLSYSRACVSSLGSKYRCRAGKREGRLAIKVDALISRVVEGEGRGRSFVAEWIFALRQTLAAEVSSRAVVVSRAVTRVNRVMVRALTW